MPASSCRWWSAITLTLAIILGPDAEAVPPGRSTEAPFLTENKAAMDRMMAGMGVKPSGDVDHDFAGMIIPHHQGAIDMAQAELRFGHNEQLRRIAQEIIVEQLQEIAAMRLALGQPIPPLIASPDQAPAPLAEAPRPQPARVR